MFSSPRLFLMGPPDASPFIAWNMKEYGRSERRVSRASPAKTRNSARAGHEKAAAPAGERRPVLPIRVTSSAARTAAYFFEVRIYVAVHSYYGRRGLPVSFCAEKLLCRINAPY
jgi:hypothetical protein